MMKRFFRKLFLCFNYMVIAGVSLLQANTQAPALETRIMSVAAICMDVSTGEVLYGKAANRIMYPASTTKVLTAVLLIEYALGTEYGWDEVVVISEYAVESIGRNASNIGLVPGESLTLFEALNAIMLASANEVTVAVAEHIGGCVPGFALLMNERASEIGARSSNFVNPTGLSDAGHVTTAMDIALIMREAVGFEIFTDVIAEREFAFVPGGRTDELALRNRNELIHEGEFYYSYAVGGKTGFTRASGNTLVNYARMGASGLITVVLNAPQFVTYRDTIAILDMVASIYSLR